MEVAKKRSKGGFLHLFDWNSKSRKKLFPNSSEESDESKHGKQVENLAELRPEMVVVDDFKALSSHKGSSEYNSASSVTSDELYGARAPGVVARLMGLDSLPTSTVQEPCSTPFLGSCSLRTSHNERTSANLWNENNPVVYYNIPNKSDMFPSNSLESRFHKVQTRPLERFQTEILPPKSAKSISIMHHKLLSPIKSPGFIPTKNAAYIMEAAAKIIEASPKTITKTKVSSFGSSSAPLRIRDLKEKMEAAHKASRTQRPLEPSVAKSMKVQSSDSSRNGSDCTRACRSYRDYGKVSSHSSRKEGKSVSLAEQAKVNVQKREGTVPSSIRSSTSMSQKEKVDVQARQLPKSQAVMKWTVEKGTSSKRTNNVLKQNNQKQNCLSNKDCSTSKTAIPNRQGRKSKSTNGTNTTGLNRNLNKVAVNSETGSRNTGSVASNTKKEFPISRRNLAGKRSVNGGLQSEGSVSGNSSMDKDERSIKCNIEIDGHMNWGSENLKAGMDVVSFTFRAPMNRYVPATQSSGEVIEKNGSFITDSFVDNDKPYLKTSKFTSGGFNIIGGDNLSVLLEKKLQELTCKFESANCNVIWEGNSGSPASSLQDSVTMTSEEHVKRLQLDIDKDASHIPNDFGYFSLNSVNLEGKREWQRLEGIKEHNGSSNGKEAGKKFDQRLLAPGLLPEHYTEGESQVDGAPELSDSASASTITIGDMGTFHSSDFKEETDWELDYVKMLLGNAELMFTEFASGQNNEVITPVLFYQLESRCGAERDEEGYSKLSRKLLFDCVSECLELRCGQLVVGTCNGWAKWASLQEKRGWLAEEVYKEIFGWRSIRDMMVDELVDKDMSTKYGRWLDFDIEAFEEGTEIEKDILTSLVDELVSDLLL